MFAYLRSVWAEPRPVRAAARLWWDWALVAVLLLVAVLETVLRPELNSRIGSLVVAAVLLPLLLLRRSRPLLAVAVAFGVAAVASLVFRGEPELNVTVFMVLFPFSLFRWGSGREAVLGLAIMLGKVGLSVVLGFISVSEAVGGSAVLGTACAIGAAVRYRGRARARELEQVKLLERERLARDLHDTVAHHVSAMAIRAQAGLATAASRPEAATEALGLIESEASRALAEMRTMVRALRHNESADLAPSPTVADVALLASRGTPGPEVDVRIDGAVDDLPKSVGTAIYRLTQESVTNARRHARHATRIEVSVVVGGSSVHLRVSDDGDARGPAVRGHGLIGMMERAHLLGGSCEAGPNPERGWTVTAVLPLTGARG
ncbi:Signal transduction histidine kinase [Lentzea waywayandensis]|uniref:histidine kinase n=1 Tax=Lentzea waywayandensis TaxID=84724 RepID=A0A1I6DA88_9PSEU|nr:histidine kinase [Lentzea waywayandensis]SFR02379.1 Signal transduction histidine kinase [Lentzea waywayandensis]